MAPCSFLRLLRAFLRLLPATLSPSSAPTPSDFVIRTHSVPALDPPPDPSVFYNPPPALPRSALEHEGPLSNLYTLISGIATRVA